MEQPPPFKTKGDPQLLEEPLTPFFCSSCYPGDLILKTYDLARSMLDAGVAVIGGFQMPMLTLDSPANKNLVDMGS